MFTDNQLATITLFDSYLRQIVTLNSQNTVTPSVIKMYSCGPTVYGYQHIGNMRAVWLPETIANMAKMAGYKVEWVSNITDVGHLVDDGDDGQDKLEKGAKRDGKDVRAIVDFYTDDYKKQCKTLNFDLPTQKMNPKATEYIAEQMILALTLLRDQKAYLLEDGIYFDSTWDRDFDQNLDTNLDIMELAHQIQTKASTHSSTFVLAIDGYGGSGKSTLAKKLCSNFKNSLYIDLDAYNIEGGDLFKQKNIDLGFDLDFENTEYDTARILKEIAAQSFDFVILDGCFSFKNLDQIAIDLKIWVESDKDLAKTRLIDRESAENTQLDIDLIKLSITKWQEAEARYLQNYNPNQRADIVVSSQNNEFKILQKTKNTNYTGRDIKNTTKNPADFALWKFVDQNSLQKWKMRNYAGAAQIIEQIKIQVESLSSTQGTTDSKQENSEISKLEPLYNNWGCPGWHSECVAMISQIIGTKRFSFNDQIETNQINSNPVETDPEENPKAEIDIHTGGEDHIDIHHKNERLQSQALGFELSKYWVHNKFVLVDAKKMSKSLGNVYTVTGEFVETGFYSFENPPIHEFEPEFKQQIAKKYLELKLIKNSNQMDWENFKFDPIAFRMMLMEHHYTDQMNFTWEKLWQSQMRLWGLRKEAAKIKIDDQHVELKALHQFNELLEVLTNNLNVSKFLELYHDLLVATTHTKNHFNTRILNFYDHNFLKLNVFPLEIDQKAEKLALARQEYKTAKDYQKSDEIRTKIQELGYQIDDYAMGYGLWWRGDC